MGKRHRTRVVLWDHSGPSGSAIRISLIEHFDARGKRRVYGRADHFGKVALNMDVWRAKNGRLLARFWQRYESRNYEVDWYSYEIIGLSVAKRPDDAAAAKRGEHWVPECLREKYHNWVVSEMPSVY